MSSNTTNEQLLQNAETHLRESRDFWGTEAGRALAKGSDSEWFAACRAQAELARERLKQLNLFREQFPDPNKAPLNAFTALFDRLAENIDAAEDLFQLGEDEHGWPALPEGMK